MRIEQGNGWTLYQGDCLDILPTLTGVDAVVTSPPYAEQRKKLYGGVPEADYPQWTVAWLDALRPALSPSGSVLIVIREHVKGGQISDYVHRTRLAVREAGWREIDELIWLKTNGPPVGHPGRPRRSWERVLWFALNEPYVNTRAGGTPTTGFNLGRSKSGARQWLAQAQKGNTNDIARCQDYVAISTAGIPGGIEHPAVYPVPLARWLIELVTPEGGTVCDPFTGSGSTGVAAIETGRAFVGIDIKADYCDMARQRLRQAEAIRQPSLLEMTGD